MKKRLARFERHVDVPTIGAAGQQKIFDASVLIVGMGGLGCPAAIYLAAAGIGRMTVVDDDTVSLSNLQRQTLYTEADIGQAKVDVALQKLKAHGEGLHVIAHRLRMTDVNAAAMVQQYDIILDCTDNFESRYVMNRACLTAQKPLITASVYQHEGQIAVFDSTQNSSPCYECVYPARPENSALPNCREAGVLGPVVGVMGTLQATLALQCIIGKTAPYVGKMHIFDALGFQFETMDLCKNPACSACGAQKKAVDIVFTGASCAI